MTRERSRVFVTSDHHFGPSSSLRFMRTFTPKREREPGAKWNAIVDSNDLVYYNGDFSDAAVVCHDCIRIWYNAPCIVVRTPLTRRGRRDHLFE
jgi:calcineurin-like phosphoesterase family protein